MQTQPQIAQALDSQISQLIQLSIQQIQQTFKTISGVTDVLDNKICTILEKHQNQFFKVYKTHMIEIQRQMKSLEEKLSQKQKELEQLHDSGAIAKLSKRVKQLERQLTIAFDKIAEKDKIISTTKLQRQLSIKEIQHLEQKLKDQMRSAVRLRLNGIDNGQFKDGRYLSQASSVDLSRNVSGQNLFATQIKTKLYKQQTSISKPKTQLSNLNIQGSITPSPEMNSSMVKEHSQLIRDKLTAQVKKLTKTNRDLLNNNLKVRSYHSQIQQFFINCIQETKKLVSVRTQNPVSKINLSQFNKQQKMNVLLLFLDSDQIISHIYTIVFKKDRSPRPSITHIEIINRVENKSQSKKQLVRKNMSKKQQRSQQKKQRNSSFEIKLPTINQNQKNNKAQVIARLLKKRQSLNYNDFL